MQPQKGRIFAICKGQQKGKPKRQIDSCRFVADYGIDGDCHAGEKTRQVSLLAKESIDKMIAKGIKPYPGIFAENLVTEGVLLSSVHVGSKIWLGNEVLLQVTQIGKECHDRCAIYHQAGDCIMPKEGIFAHVLVGGNVKTADTIEILEDAKI